MPDRQRDEGYAWVILICCAGVMFISSLICLGVFGVLLMEMIIYFPRVSKATIGLVGALQFAAFGVVGFVAGPITKKFGCRYMILAGTVVMVLGLVISFYARSIYILHLSFGLMTGLGSACHQIGALVGIQTNFDKKRALAMGTVFFGTSLGVMSGAPLAVLLVRTYGLHGAFLILAGLALQCFWLGSLVRPISQNKAINVHQTKETSTLSDQKIPEPPTTNHSILGVTGIQTTKCMKYLGIEPLRNVFYSTYLFSLYLEHLGHFVPFALLPYKATFFGQSETKSALLVTYIAGMTAVLAPLVGVLGDRIPRHRGYVCAISSMMTAALTMSSAFVNIYWGQVTYAVLFGTSSSLYVVLHSVVPVDIWGVEIIETFTSHLYMAIGMAMLTVNPVNGAILDRTNIPNLPFLIFGLLHFGGGILMLFSIIGGERRARS